MEDRAYTAGVKPEIGYLVNVEITLRASRRYQQAVIGPYERITLALDHKRAALAADTRVDDCHVNSARRKIS